MFVVFARACGISPHVKSVAEDKTVQRFGRSPSEVLRDSAAGGPPPFHLHRLIITRRPGMKNPGLALAPGSGGF